jgi:hypothetical protein
MRREVGTTSAPASAIPFAMARPQPYRRVGDENSSCGFTNLVYRTVLCSIEQQMPSTIKTAQKSYKLKAFRKLRPGTEIVLVCFVRHVLKSTLELEIGHTT